MKGPKVVGDCGSGKQVAGSKLTTPIAIEIKRAMARVKGSERKGSDPVWSEEEKKNGHSPRFLLVQGGVDRQDSHMKIRAWPQSKQEVQKKKRKAGNRAKQSGQR